MKPQSAVHAKHSTDMNLLVKIIPLYSVLCGPLDKQHVGSGKSIS